MWRELIEGVTSEAEFNAPVDDRAPALADDSLGAPEVVYALESPGDGGHHAFVEWDRRTAVVFDAWLCAARGARGRIAPTVGNSVPVLCRPRSGRLGTELVAELGSLADD